MTLTTRPADGPAIADAVAMLRRGGLVAMPTETVYGLAADAAQASAVAQIFAAKGRPSHHPLIVHVAGVASVDQYVSETPPFAHRLMKTFWPGPLTVILPRRPSVAADVAGGQSSIGIRCPSHPVAQALLIACLGVGIQGLAAPSANRFGRVSPTRAAHVLDEFQGLLDDSTLLVLDGGPCQVGIESTIIDCTRSQPVLLRPGMLAVSALEAAAGMPLAERDDTAPRASGTLASHYAPRARVRLMNARDMQQALDVLGPDARHMAVYTRTPVTSASAHVRMERMPTSASACAQQLFAALRALDQHDTRLIWVETPPDDPAWNGVRDRLQRAAA